MSVDPIVKGVRLGTARAAIKYPDRRDLALIEISPGSKTAAVFTRNAFCAAPVIVSKRHLSQSAGADARRYLLINAGNANAGTGQAGIDDALACCAEVARLGNSAAAAVLPFSTGVIGERLPIERMRAGIAEAFAKLTERGWSDAAHAIMTTDTCPKLISRQLSLGGQAVTVAGIAKGSGMIKPDMATMLAFIATDAMLEQNQLQECLREAVADSFNAITIDGDTSTNDACVLIATGAAGVVVSDSEYTVFDTAVREVCRELAQALVRDGEGASKFITIVVENGKDTAECRQVAYTVAHSPLVKTAFFASDPNWGRILAAVGRAGLTDLDIEGISIYLDDVCIVRAGARAGDYTEERGGGVMQREHITVRIQLGRGPAQARIWTTDLSHDYVRINAEYRS